MTLTSTLLRLESAIMLRRHLQFVLDNDLDPDHESELVDELNDIVEDVERMELDLEERWL